MFNPNAKPAKEEDVKDVQPLVHSHMDAGEERPVKEELFDDTLNEERVALDEPTEQAHTSKRRKMDHLDTEPVANRWKPCPSKQKEVRARQFCQVTYYDSDDSEEAERSRASRATVSRISDAHKRCQNEKGELVATCTGANCTRVLCELCLFEFCTIVSLMEHKEAHHRIFQCRTCKMFFPKKSKLQSHYKSLQKCAYRRWPELVDDEGATTFKCDYCPFEQDTRQQVVTHKERRHKIFHCHFCSTLWQTKKKRKEHLETCNKLKEMLNRLHASNDEEKIMTRKESRLPDGFVRLQAKVQAEKDEMQRSLMCMLCPVVCPMCKAQFRNMVEFGEWAHRCMLFSLRMFHCSGCGEYFDRASHLKRHLLLQFSRRINACFDAGRIRVESRTFPEMSAIGSSSSSNIPVAAAAISTPEEIREHASKIMLVHAYVLYEHLELPVEDYYGTLHRMFWRLKCYFCNEKCGSYAALYNHCRWRHRPEHRCLFMCTGCSTTFSTPTDLAVHLKREMESCFTRCYDTVSVLWRNIPAADACVQQDGLVPAAAVQPSKAYNVQVLNSTYLIQHALKEEEEDEEDDDDEEEEDEDDDDDYDYEELIRKEQIAAYKEREVKEESVKYYEDGVL